MSNTIFKLPFFRWIIAFILSAIALFLLFWGLFKTEKNTPYIEQPPIRVRLQQFIEKPKETKKPEKETAPPKTKKKKVVKKKAIKKPVEKVVQKAIAEKTTPKEVDTKEPLEINQEPTQEVDSQAVSKPAPELPPGPLRISGAANLDNNDFSPLVNPAPKYPTIARRAGIEGHVDLDLTINTDGTIKEYRIVSVHGHSSFTKETEKVIMKWRFPPPRIKGKPRAVKYLYKMKFKLTG